MSTTTLAAPIRVNTAGVHTRPGIGRLVAVELRKRSTPVPALAAGRLVAITSRRCVAWRSRAAVTPSLHHQRGLQAPSVLRDVGSARPSEWSQRTGSLRADAGALALRGAKLSQSIVFPSR